MQNITIGRYSNPEELGCAASIEGRREDGSSWILFLDENGSPFTYWSQREPDGAVIGEPVVLS